MTSAVLPALEQIAEVPAHPDEKLTAVEKGELANALERIARIRRDTEVEAASLKLA